MRLYARETAGWGAAVIGALLLAAGCRPATPELPVAEVVTLPTASASSLFITREGRVWIGEPGAMLLLDGAALVSRTPLGGPVPEVVGENGGWLLVRTHPGMLHLVDGATGELLAAGEVNGVPLLDVRARWVFGAAGSGAVLIHDTDSLRLISAWSALGTPATAIAASPEGDRIYLALEDEQGSVILTRDVQTGRVLRTSTFAAPFSSLIADRDGNLVGVLGRGDDAAIVSLRPWGAELELRWRVRLDADADHTRLRLSPDGSQVAVLDRTRTQNGLRVLDAETGSLIGSIADSPLDAHFDAAGRLVLLYPGEYRVIR